MGSCKELYQKKGGREEGREGGETEKEGEERGKTNVDAATSGEEENLIILS
jgi:hypothetical protein